MDRTVPRPPLDAKVLWSPNDRTDLRHRILMEDMRGTYAPVSYDRPRGEAVHIQYESNMALQIANAVRRAV